MKTRIITLPISRTLSSNYSSTNPQTASLEQVLQSYRKETGKSHENVIQRLTKEDALIYLSENEEYKALLEEWLNTKDESIDANEFLKNMALDDIYPQLNRFKRIKSSEAVVPADNYKLYKDIQEMSLSEFNNYTKEQLDWFVNLKDKQYHKISKRLRFICHHEEVLAPCENFKIKDLHQFKYLKVYSKAVHHGDPIDLDKTDNIEKALKLGEGIKRLVESSGQAILLLKSSLKEKSFIELIDNNCIDSLAEYCKIDNTPYFQSDRDYDGYISLSKGGDLPISYSKDEVLCKHIRNYHRFKKEVLERLKTNYTTKPIHPVILILQSALDNSGAFVCDTKVEDIVCHPNFHTLLIEGKATIEEAQAAINDIIATCAISQVMIAGHGLQKSIQVAGTLSEKEGKIEENEKSISVVNKEERIKTKDLFGVLLDGMKEDREREHRIVFNGCLTNSNKMNVNKLPDMVKFDHVLEGVLPESDFEKERNQIKSLLLKELLHRKDQREISSETIEQISTIINSIDESKLDKSTKDTVLGTVLERIVTFNEKNTSNDKTTIVTYLSKHPNLTTYVQSVAKEAEESLSGPKTQIIGANASFGKAELIKDNLLGLYPNNDRALTANKIDYVQYGHEPTGAICAVIECWATESKETLEVALQWRIAQTPHNWNDCLIQYLYELIKERINNITFICTCQILTAPLSELGLSNANSSRISSLKNTRNLDTEVIGFFECIHSKSYCKPHSYLLILQHWMLVDNSKIPFFFDQIKSQSCAKIKQYINFNYITSTISSFMKGSYEPGKLCLALLGVINAKDNCFKEYLLSILPANKIFPPAWKVSKVLAGMRTEEEILKAIINEETKTTEKENKFHMERIVKSRIVKRDEIQVFSSPNNMFDIVGTLHKDDSVTICGAGDGLYAIRYLKESTLIIAFIRQKDVRRVKHKKSITPVEV